MIQRVLIIKFWALGDILMATPILRALKTLYPNCRISWLVDNDYAGALEGNPLLDEVIPFDSGKWRRDYRYFRLLAYFRQSFAIRRELRARNFDTTLCLTAEKWWTLWFLTSKVTVGLFPTVKKNWLSRFYTFSVFRADGQLEHNTDLYLKTVRALNDSRELDRSMSYSVTSEHEESVDRFLADRFGSIGTKPLLVLHPGTSQKSKCWPEHLYSALIDRVAGDFDIVISGSPKEVDLVNRILDGASKTNSVAIAAGTLISLGSTGALISRAKMVVTGDTAALHIASALNIPFVALYGSSRPGGNSPLFGRFALMYDDTVSCAPCYRSVCPLTGTKHMQCMEALTVDLVSDRIQKLLTVGQTT